MTAREKSLEAASKTLGANPPRGARLIAQDCADAASDVWEPLLSDAVDLIEHYIDLTGEPTEAEWAVYYRLRKALR